VTIGIIVGIVMTVVAGAILMATHVISWGSGDSSDAAADTRTVTLPAVLGGLRTQLTVVGEKSSGKPDVVEKQKARQDNTVRLTTAAYTKAYGGAASGMEVYANDDLTAFISVIAVRGGSSNGLANGPVNDPADLGTAQNQSDVVRTGDVDCIVTHTRFTQANEPVDPKNDLAGYCQRTAPGLTIGATGRPPDGPEGTALMVKIIDEAWAALGGGA
jgi:hypothetical protein